MRTSARPSETSTASDAMADIALNTLGLTLIVLMVFMMQFRSQSRNLVETKTNSDSVLLAQENKRLKKQVLKLEEQISKQVQQAHDSGLWQMELHVTGWVGHDGQVEHKNQHIIYFVHLQIEEDRISGTLFGVREDEHNNESNSASHAKVVGTANHNLWTLEFQFTGTGQGASEKMILTKQGSQLVGELQSGRTKPGTVNYSGKVVGKRLENSVFARPLTSS